MIESAYTHGVHNFWGNSQLNDLTDYEKVRSRANSTIRKNRSKEMINQSGGFAFSFSLKLQVKRAKRASARVACWAASAKIALCALSGHVLPLKFPRVIKKIAEK